MTVISQPTIEVLKNFCAINKSIVIKPGNTISTLSLNKNILAIAEVEEQFDSQISIYDLGVFIGGLNTLDAPKIDTSNENYVTVSDSSGIYKSRFFYADPDIITQPPEREITLPSEDVKFRLRSLDLDKLQRVASIYSLSDLCLVGHKGEMELQLTDKKNETSNDFAVVVGETDGKFVLNFKVENIKLIPGSYDVVVSQKLLSKFTCREHDLTYYIALEPDSSYEE